MPVDSARNQQTIADCGLRIADCGMQDVNWGLFIPKSIRCRAEIRNCEFIGIDFLPRQE